MVQEERPLTVREFSEWAQVTPWTVRQWIKHDRIKAQKIGGEWRIDPSERRRFAPDVQAKEAL